MRHSPIPTAAASPIAMPAAYSRILAALQRTPGLSRPEIAQAAHVAASTLSGGGYLRRMKELKLIHVSGWRQSASGAFSIPLHSTGRAKDCPRPEVTRKTREAPGMKQLLEVIERYGPVDYRQAAQLCGLAINTVKNSGYLAALVAQRKIHIAGWRRSRSGPPCPLYDIGAGKPAEQPPRLTSAERTRAHRKQRKAIQQQSGSLAAQLERLHSC